VTTHELPRVEQEREAVSTRAIVRIAALAVVVIVLAVLVSTRLLRRDVAEVRGSALPRTTPTAEAPRVIGIVDQTLTSRPGTGLVQNESEKLALHRYAWVDRAHGVARIPIDRAISLYVARQSLSDAGAAP
jgi:cell division septation protein DedD